jgi:serine phosphatase RsbU (regulator of sigma subunit)
MRGGQTLPVELEHQLPLGMFADTRYAPQEVALLPGDRLFVVSDGVHEATPGGRSSFGERNLLAAMRATRLQPGPEAVASVMRALNDYHQGENLEDDAVIVCLDLSAAAGEPSAS